MMEEEYVFDAFADGRARAMATEQRGVALQDFLGEYAGRLREVEDALSAALPDDPAVPPQPAVALDMAPVEHANLLQLTATANKPVNKLVSVFSYLVVELDSLSDLAEKKFYGPLAFYGAHAVPAEQMEGITQKTMSKFLPILTDLSNFLTRLYAVACNVVRQLGALYHPKQQLYANLIKTMHLHPIYEALARAFGVLITLDELVSGNADLNTAWSKYRLMMKPVIKEPARFNANEDDVARLERLLDHLQGAIFDGMILGNCINQGFDFSDLVQVRGNAVLRNDFRKALELMAAEFKVVPDTVEAVFHRELLPGFFGLLSLYNVLFNNVGLDKKFARDVVEIATTYVVHPLWGDRCMVIPAFLTNELPEIIRVAHMSALNQPRILADYRARIMKTFTSELEQFSLYTTVWMARMEANHGNRMNLQQCVDLRIRLSREGLYLAMQIAYKFRTIVGVHLASKVSLTTADVRALCQCIVLIKAIDTTFQREMVNMAEMASLMNQRISIYMLQILAPARRPLEQSARLKQGALDILAALTMATSMLRGCATVDRRAVLNVTLAMVVTGGVLNPAAGSDLVRSFRKLSIMSDMPRSLAVCKTPFFYFHREMLPFEFAHIFKNPHLAPSVRHLCTAVADIVPYMRLAQHADPDVLVKRFHKEVFDVLSRGIIEPLQLAIDEDLRLQTHLHLRVADKNPFFSKSDNDNKSELVHLLNLRQLFVVDRYEDMRELVSRFLETNFYNTNTVALYDWRTYEEMRILAKNKYGLLLADGYLPSQTLEQGLDVLMIMKRIHLFVAEYNYNMNNQFFIERQSKSKTLNTIGINTVANSIRTHGIGIMNTTVNFTYQYLKTMFEMFSQFLFDEHIRSPLTKELKYFRAHKEELNLKYPFDRAEKFNKDIRKLGTTTRAPGGAESSVSLTYLDRFRMLITQIGNAMGYVRMIRSGGLLACANAMKFAPDLAHIPEFAAMVEADKLSPESVAAAKTVDLSVGNMGQSFLSGFEYFQILVQVFATEFRSEENRHLRNFFGIIPALSLNYVEYILDAKDKVTKKASQLHADGYVFCDDGFAIGVAYILKLLDQTDDFDSIHWFDSVRDHYEGLQREIAARASKRGKKEQQTSVMTANKVKLYLQEFELLRYSFAGAKIFFDN